MPPKLTDLEEQGRVDELLDVVREGTKAEQMLAAEALGRLRNPVAVPLFSERLRKHEDQPVRARAARTLGSIGDSSAVDALLSALEAAPPEKDRMWIAYALGEAGDPRAVEPLRRLLAEPSWAVRLYAVRALGRIGTGEAAGALGDALSDRHLLVFRAAAEELGDRGDQGEQLLAAASASIRGLRRFWLRDHSIRD